MFLPGEGALLSIPSLRLSRSPPLPVPPAGCPGGGVEHVRGRLPHSEVRQRSGRARDARPTLAGHSLPTPARLSCCLPWSRLRTRSWLDMVSSARGSPCSAHRTEENREENKFSEDGFERRVKPPASRPRPPPLHPHRPRPPVLAPPTGLLCPRPLLHLAPRPRSSACCDPLPPLPRAKSTHSLAARPGLSVSHSHHSVPVHRSRCHVRLSMPIIEPFPGVKLLTGGPQEPRTQHPGPSY